MFAPHWHSNVAQYTVIPVIVLPQAEKLVDDRLLLSTAIGFGYVSRIFQHGKSVEVGAKAKGDYE